MGDRIRCGGFPSEAPGAARDHRMGAQAGYRQHGEAGRNSASIGWSTRLAASGAVAIGLALSRGKLGNPR